MSYPNKFKNRQMQDLRLGIKSSYNNIRNTIALLYCIYVANGKKSICNYGVEDGNVQKLDDTLMSSIVSFIGNPSAVSYIKGSKLITSQIEAIQVCLELVFGLAKVSFNSSKSNLSERTGRNRYPKQLSFSSNILILDSILSSASEREMKDFLNSWMANESCKTNPLESKVSEFLTLQSEKCVLKMRFKTKDDLFFQQEGIYEILSTGAVGVEISDDEKVGTFRVLNSFINEGLHAYLINKNGELQLREGKSIDELKNYLNEVSTTLDLSESRNITQDSDFVKMSYSAKQLSKSDDIPKSLDKFITAIRTKPFVLLAGISGTGKSRIVRQLAKACWPEGSVEAKAQKPSNFEMVQVKPNWHDSSELLGYVSRIGDEPEFIAGDFLRFIVKAWSHKNIPHFLCLDEMNLAPVEQYFAEYLSVVESRKLLDDNVTIKTDALLMNPLTETDPKTGAPTAPKWYERLVKELLAAAKCPDNEVVALREQFLTQGIAIPQNLIVIGTVNMDETTYSFSRKVLDRAMTIEMNEVDLNGGLQKADANIKPIPTDHFLADAVEGYDVYGQYKEACDIVIEYLGKINTVLEGTPFKVAYRTRNEFLIYVVNALRLAHKDEADKPTIAQALDEVTSMKILSRIEGDKRKVHFLGTLRETIDLGLKEISEVSNSVSLAKLTTMGKRLESGYTSFWD